jgi:hypothetical protein
MMARFFRLRLPYSRADNPVMISRPSGTHSSANDASSEALMITTSVPKGSQRENTTSAPNRRHRSLCATTSLPT